MKFIADLHIHSKYSRATAKNLDFENLYYAAQIKGIGVVGTGDFTYPAWVDEIDEKLEETEPGLFSLKKEFAEKIDQTIPENCRNPVRFILQTEISNIYKKDGRVRKNHNLIYFPDMASVRKFNARLDAIGNIKSDGRPILGLDAADLLSLMLEINDKGMFIPAHIWTPWFSLFGSKSGFDSLEECFGDLKNHIFAVETGLSSDPPMNWRVEDLDGLRLISNSDAHSPGYLGRNASVFDTQMSFAHIRKALETNNLETYQGTLDMFPHQGKYHYDGHRNCNVCLNPADTLEMDGICPECGKPMTCGVLYRVQQLASRPEGYQPENRHGYKSIIPLPDILSEIFEVGPKTKKVTTHYNKAIETLGPELGILLDLSLDRIETANIPMLPEAIEKMRKGQIKIDPGYDGEYGKVNIFSQEEKEKLKGEKYFLFKFPKKKASSKQSKKKALKTRVSTTVLKKKSAKQMVQNEPEETDLLGNLNPEQKRAVESPAKRIIIQAGPGTGKTRTLTAKIAYLVSVKKVDPGSILALTFTNKAARQLEQRVEKYVKQKDSCVLAATFHAFCLKLLKKHTGLHAGAYELIADDAQRRWLIKKAIGKKTGQAEIKKTDQRISLCKQRLLSFDDDLSPVVGEDYAIRFKEIYKAYEEACREYQVMDFEDLIFNTVQMLHSNDQILLKIQQNYPYVFIDEYQDLNFAQYTLVKLMCKKSNIVVIGDPDQSIYAFRGSDNIYFKQFADDFPGCEKIELNTNYRSTQTILDASFQMITKNVQDNETIRIMSHAGHTRQLIIKESATEISEAVSIAKMIEKLVGGTSFFSMDTGRADSEEQKEYSFSDFAILYRTSRQCETFLTVFEKEGIPCQSADKTRLVDLNGIRQLICICRMLVKNSFDQNPDEMDLAVLSDILKRKSDVKQLLSKISRDRNTLQQLNQGEDVESCIQGICRIAGILEQIEADEKSKAGFEKILGIARTHTDLNSFLDALALNQDADTIGFDTQKVSLMTIHAAKGLEYPVVFVAGCEQGLIPFARDGKNINDLEEERRLFYVAMTRAMDILYLTYAKKRRIFGSIEKRQQSMFIRDIEKKLAQFETMPFKLAVQKKETQLELF